jgi:release factor glutamine methyltransferase
VELPPEIRDHEPRTALDGGPDGLRVIDRLLGQLPGKLTPGGRVVLEIGYDQGAAVQRLIEARLPAAQVQVLPDLAGLDRLAVIRT